MKTFCFPLNTTAKRLRVGTNQTKIISIMKISPITKFPFKGKEYNSLLEIKGEIHNTIGLEVIDKIIRVCPPQQHKDLFKLLDVICSPEVRAVLLECLNVTFEQEEDCSDWRGIGERIETINVLDLK